MFKMFLNINTYISPEGWNRVEHNDLQNAPLNIRCFYVILKNRSFPLCLLSQYLSHLTSRQLWVFTMKLSISFLLYEMNKERYGSNLLHSIYLKFHN